MSSVAEIAVVPHRGLEVEDEPAELGDGGVEALDRLFHVVAVAGVLHPRGESLEHETYRKEVLDDGVVEVAGDSLAVFHHRQPPQLLLESDVGDGRARDGGKCLDSFVRHHR